MTEPLLYRIDGWVIALALFLGMVLLWELFYRRGLRQRGVRSESSSELLGSIDTAVGGLLALILAFSFSMAASRFEAREEAIISEAKALETAHFRCQIMVPSEQANCRRDLATYARLRVAYYDAKHDQQRLAEVQRRSKALGRVVWERALRTVSERDSPSRALLIASLNDLFERNTDREAARRRVVPQEVTLVTLCLCLAWSSFSGFAFGLGGNRQFGAWVGFAALVTAVFYVTLDFDRPGRGFIRPERGNSVMVELSKSFEANP